MEGHLDELKGFTVHSAPHASISPSKSSPTPATTRLTLRKKGHWVTLRHLNDNRLMLNSTPKGSKRSNMVLHSVLGQEHPQSMHAFAPV